MHLGSVAWSQSFEAEEWTPILLSPIRLRAWEPYASGKPHLITMTHARI